MARIDPKKDPIRKKDKPEANPVKSQRLADLKEKLAAAEKKLKSDPDNKGLLRVKRNLEEMFARERARGYKG